LQRVLGWIWRKGETLGGKVNWSLTLLYFVWAAISAISAIFQRASWAKSVWNCSNITLKKELAAGRQEQTQLSLPLTDVFGRDAYRGPLLDGFRHGRRIGKAGGD
jgi:hypothetical protein